MNTPSTSTREKLSMVDGLEDRAKRAYLNHCRRNGYVAQQAGSVTYDGDQVVLRNVRGELARYWYDAKRDRLRAAQTTEPTCPTSRSSSKRAND